MPRLMTIAVCSCGLRVVDAKEMNTHGVGNPVHNWVYCPDIVLTSQPVVGVTLAKQAAEIESGKEDCRLHRRRQRLRHGKDVRL